MSSELPKHFQLPTKTLCCIYNNQIMNWFEKFFRIGKRIISMPTTKMIDKPVQWKNSVLEVEYSSFGDTMACWEMIILFLSWDWEWEFSPAGVCEQEVKEWKRGQRGCSSQAFFVLHKQTISTLKPLMASGQEDESYKQKGGKIDKCGHSKSFKNNLAINFSLDLV